jgi:hypothetical protein
MNGLDDGTSTRGSCPHPEAALVTGDRLRELTPDMGQISAGDIGSDGKGRHRLAVCAAELSVGSPLLSRK